MKFISWCFTSVEYLFAAVVIGMCTAVGLSIIALLGAIVYAQF